jgi:hypothetical protein
MAGTESVLHGDMVVCACDTQEYRARDAVDAAFIRGELDSFWAEFLQRIAFEKRAEELEMELNEDALDSAAEAFRYEHDLITAEETEQWLAARGLTLGDFGDYFARKCWPSAFEEEVAPENIPFVSAPPELRELFIADLILSGGLDRMTAALTWRLAALSATAEEDVDPDRIATERRNFFDRRKIDSGQLSDRLKSLGHDSEWFDQMLRMEAAYQGCRATLLDPQAQKKQLAMLRLPLTRFEVEVIEVESRDAAQEALFCVRDDGISMEEVAWEGRYPYRQISFLQEDIPTELQQKFLSVGPGEVLEPIARGDDGFELYHVIKKVEPQPDDPAVQARIDQRLLERHFSELASKYIETRLPAVASAE